MTSRPSTLTAFIDAAADRVARAIAGIQKEAHRERELRDAQFAAKVAELDVRLAAVSETERRLADRLATLKDGASGRDGVDGSPGRDGLDGAAGKDGRDGTNGRDADPELIGTMVARAVAELPPAKDGQDGKDADPIEIVRLLVPEVERRFVENPVFRGEKGDRGDDGSAGRDGIDGAAGQDGVDGAPGKDGVDGKDGRDGVDGKDAPAPTLEQVTEAAREMLPDMVGKAVSDHLIANAPPAGRDGKDGVDGLDGKDGVEGAPGRDGKLPLVRDWTDGVHYEGDVVFHDGGTWQALRDTGREPPHADWQCLAKAGRDGKDGRSFTVRGTWGDAVEYCALDVVALNGGAFVARKDDPGACPGEGWQMLAMQGKPGRPGERGVGSKGERGEAGPPVVTMSVNGEGLLTLTNADGSEVTCDLYPLLAKLG